MRPNPGNAEQALKTLEFYIDSMKLQGSPGGTALISMGLHTPGAIFPHLQML